MKRPKPELGDGAIAARALARELAPVEARFLKGTASGQSLSAIGQANDIKLCARVDSVPVVPVLRDRQIVKYQ
jgi:phosphosulfolactate phosphohydrolase-like enzyme